MIKKTYESENVSISRATRLKHIAATGAVSVLGITILVVNAMAPPSDTKFASLFWGAVVTGLGLVFLVQSVKKTHERVPTAAGKAAIAVDAKITAQRAANRDAAVMKFVFWVAAIAGVIYSIDPIADLFANRITVYPVNCSTSVTETGKCANNGERVDNVTKYIVHVDQQLVVGLTENARAPIKLFNCVVADTRNWSCTFDPEKASVRLVMHDGNFSYDPPSRLAGTRFTSRWRYLWIKYTHDK